MICTRGNHDLIEIYRAGALYDEEDVVRWCKVCGAIVVDTDFDGRTKSGGIMPMRFPKGRK